LGERLARAKPKGDARMMRLPNRQAQGNREEDNILLLLPTHARQGVTLPSFFSKEGGRT